MVEQSLQALLDRAGAIQPFLYNNPTGARVYPVVPPEFTNWRDEQHAWRETVCLFDLSYHMTDLFLWGPDAFSLLARLAVNSFTGFAPGQAKQLVCVTPDGYLIGDGILFYLEDGTFQIVGRPSLHNWIQYHAATSGAAVSWERDEWSVTDPQRPRKTYRFQVQGPHAQLLLERLLGGTIPDVPFFHFTRVNIAGHTVGMLHHGMAGVAGAEFFGPFAEGAAVKAAILEAGKDLGLRQVGSRAYATNGLESGWIPNPLPAIYTGDELRPYREWLPATSYEAVGSLGGSFVSPDITDYYLTPWDLGYGRLVKFDHDFVGRAALERLANQPHRKKVTLVWDPDEAVRVIGSLFTKPKGERYKYFDLPLAQYATWMYDAVLDDAGKVVGFSMWTGFSSNEERVLSLATVDAAVATVGTRLRIVWGEPNGGSRKPSVERHVQTEVAVTVGPAPYAEPARQYRAAIARRRT
ncbi:MAG: aminomethyl transferase family protein [Thermorudis peleae]|nr:aminomethyl transferase family protein [Thermorudis peleae]